jgi:hypothetical protein
VDPDAGVEARRRRARRRRLSEGGKLLTLSIETPGLLGSVMRLPLESPARGPAALQEF